MHRLLIPKRRWVHRKKSYKTWPGFQQQQKKRMLGASARTQWLKNADPKGAQGAPMRSFLQAARYAEGRKSPKKTPNSGSQLSLKWLPPPPWETATTLGRGGGVKSNEAGPERWAGPSRDKARSGLVGDSERRGLSAPEALWGRGLKFRQKN